MLYNRFIIGNMGNPTITRLGKTQMWYKNYYSDFYFSNTFKKVHTFENLLNVYFKYGLFYQGNLFSNSFWYRKSNFSKKENIINNINKFHTYFRKFYYAHKTLTIEHSYFIRLKTPEFFPLKLYIMKYKNWMVLSLQWFKPLKKTKKNFYNSSLKTPNHIIYNRTRPLTHNYVNHRSTLFYTFLKSFLGNFLRKTKYTF